MAVIDDILEALETLADPAGKVVLQRFFKTGKGQYGEGDVFLGIKVPEQRAVAKAFYKAAVPGDVESLLKSDIHEHRLTAAFILTLQYKAAASPEQKQAVFDCYISNRSRINNWDIVDSSTHKIVGPYVHETGQFSLLYELAAEPSLWSKRIAVVALWFLWKKGYVTEGLDLIARNLEHPHDLMHKANGWMLRELAKTDENAMLGFLEQHYKHMPRTTLRYAIEKLDKPVRKNILRGIFP